MNWAIYKKGFKAFLQLEKSLSTHSVEAYLRDIDKLTNYFESIEKENMRQDIYKDQEIAAKKKNTNKLDIKSVMSQLKKDREQVDESTFPDIKKKPPGQRD